MLPEADQVRLRHMVEAAQAACRFADQRSRDEIESDQLLSFALVRAIEIVGEAASKITPATRQRFSHIPWPAIVSMRNRLVHAYFDIDPDRLWDTIQEDLPVLIVQLAAVLAEAS